MVNRLQLKRYTVTMSSSGTSSWLKLNHGPNHHNYTIVVEITGTATVDVELTADDPSGTPLVFQHEKLNNLTTSKASDFFSPAQGMRLNVTSYTSGNINLVVTESS